jgi:hypothetical protein
MDQTFGPQLPVAFCRSCRTRLTFEPAWVTFKTRGWRCHCTGCVDGEYVGDPLTLQTDMRAGEGECPWEALDDCAAMQWDCEPEELMR